MRQVTVLASGGIDSTACIAYYVRRGDSVRALWVDYGQAAAPREAVAVRRVAGHYGVPLEIVRLEGVAWGMGAPAPSVPREYPGRNLTLAALALNSGSGARLIALGIHVGTPFADCSQGFAERLDALLALLSAGAARLDCPFLRWSKADVAQWARLEGLPFHLTYSCERGAETPCGGCAKCQDAAETSRVSPPPSVPPEPQP